VVKWGNSLNLPPIGSTHCTQRYSTPNNTYVKLKLIMQGLRTMYLLPWNAGPREDNAHPTCIEILNGYTKYLIKEHYQIWGMRRSCASHSAFSHMQRMRFTGLICMTPDRNLVKSQSLICNNKWIEDTCQIYNAYFTCTAYECWLNIHNVLIKLQNVF
jgi:hypothetical protein